MATFPLGFRGNAIRGVERPQDGFTEAGRPSARSIEDRAAPPLPSALRIARPPRIARGHWTTTAAAPSSAPPRHAQGGIIGVEAVGSAGRQSATALMEAIFGPRQQVREALEPLGV